MAARGQLPCPNRPRWPRRTRRTRDAGVATAVNTIVASTSPFHREVRTDAGQFQRCLWIGIPTSVADANCLRGRSHAHPLNELLAAGRLFVRECKSPAAFQAFAFHAGSYHATQPHRCFQKGGSRTIRAVVVATSRLISHNRRGYAAHQLGNCRHLCGRLTWRHAQDGPIDSLHFPRLRRTFVRPGRASRPWAIRGIVAMPVVRVLRHGAAGP